LLLNRILTKDNLFKRGVIQYNNQRYMGDCGFNEDIDHLFVTCNFFGNIRGLVSLWQCFVTMLLGSITAHHEQFCCSGGIKKKARLAFKIIWLGSVLIIWKERNNRIFTHKEDNLQSLLEKN